MKYSSWLTTLIAPGWVINARPVPVSKLHARNHIWYFESFTKTWRLQPYVFVRMKARMWGTKEPSSTSREGIPCTELKPTQSENIFWQKISFFTKKSFSSDGGNETVQRVLVNQSPSFLVSRLVHYPRLHNIGRSPHDGSNQAEGKNSEVWGGGDHSILLTPHRPRTWCVWECCPPSWCCPGCSSWHCRRWRDHRGWPELLARHLASSLATVPAPRPAAALSWQIFLHQN